MEEQVIIVNSSDQPLGVMPKMEAHIKGVLHRAFSIFIFNSKNELLMHQRALEKYHSGGLWTNTCCSHPRPGEATETAAIRRLQEEMGFTTEIEELFFFKYRKKLSNGLIENEVDHVFVGKYDGNIYPNQEEVITYEYINVEDLQIAVQQHPERYTEWLKICLPELLEKLGKWAA